VTGIVRRAWYFVIGAFVAWAWHRIRRVDGAGGEMVSVVVTIPKSILPPMIAGVAVEAQGILMGHVMPSADDDGTDGIDPATGMPFNGPDAER
jgi:hypothetical protein